MKRTHHCRRPQNSLFVGGFMVKAPRTHKQCPDTAVSFSFARTQHFPPANSHNAASLRAAFSSLGLLKKSTPTLKVTRILPPSLPAKGTILKINSLWIQAPPCCRVGGAAGGVGGSGSPSIVCHLSRKTHFNIKRSA